MNNQLARFSQHSGYPGRWSLWYFDPNETALLIVYILCLLTSLIALWGTKRRRLVGYAYLVLLIGMLAASMCALVRTGSRGGCVAAVFAMAAILSAILLSFRRQANLTRIVFMTMLIIAVALGSFFGVGVPSRFSADYAKSDSSIGNRLAIWEVSARMIHDSHLWGWRSQSAEIYSYLYSSRAKPTLYKNLASGVLDVSVGYGLCGILVWMSVVALISLLLAGIITGGGSQAPPILEAYFTSCSAGIFVAFLASNVFSSHLQYIFMTPWLLAILTIVVMGRQHLQRATVAVLVGCFALTLVIIPAIVSLSPAARSVQMIERIDSGWLRLVRPSRTDISLDDDSRNKMFIYYSESNRSLSAMRDLTRAAAFRYEVFLRFRPGLALPSQVERGPNDIHVFIGDAFQGGDQSALAGRRIYIFPNVMPSRLTDQAGSAVILGSLQPRRIRKAWEQWARDTGARITYLDGIADELPTADKILAY